MLNLARWLSAAASAALLVTVGCAAPVPTPSASPTPVPTPSPTCAPAADRPPAATILDAQGNEVEGLLGGYRFCAGSSEAPSPSAAGLPHVQLTDDEVNVVVSTTDGPPFISWLAYATGAQGSAPGAVKLAEGSNDLGVDSISFAGPRSGESTLVVTLTFPGEIGGATYWWDVTVP